MSTILSFLTLLIVIWIMLMVAAMFNGQEGCVMQWLLTCENK